MPLADGALVLIGPESRDARPAVLWVHGYTLSSRIWEPLWARLPQFQHYAVDLPGHGRSEHWDCGWSLPQLGQAIGELAREHTLEHLVGLSFGGTVAMQVGIEHPDLFSSLTLAGHMLGGGPVDLESQRCNRELMGLFQTRGLGPWLQERWLQQPPDIFRHAAKHPALWELLKQVVREHAFRELGSGMVATWMQHQPRTSELGAIRSPVTIVVGEAEMPALKRCAQLTRRALSDSRCHYLPGAGHLSLLEQPGAAAELLQQAFAAPGPD